MANHIQYNYPGSIKNSTNTPLGAGETFTGGAEAVSITENSQSVSICVYTDTESATNGFQMQFSGNGVDWDQGQVFKHTIPANTPVSFEHNFEHRYFRVIYRTLAAQTVFRLQTKFNTRAAVQRQADTPIAVRISDGARFFDSFRADCVQLRIMQATEDLLTQQKITNLHLSKMTGEEFIEQDIEE